ncbi:sensor histidine kinase [Flexithrix dorotheae]|uniref:sensor histidine kinase n=1 Tax=Flexithrix dorotheae TaxID=70993 RepID=UPI00037202F7|nr:HAMP domain-containing sensor histidine kinase [Flexithrix dorotheae]
MKKIWNSLYWRMSAILLLLLVFLGLAYVVITAYSANLYFQETNQRLSKEIAPHIVTEVSPFLQDGNVSEDNVHEIMVRMMTINPSLEIYILSSEGKILDYVAPYKKIKLNFVSTKPIKEYLENEGNIFISGDDPRNPGKTKVFSAAEVNQDGKTLGYVYVILASEEYESVANMLYNNYMLKVGSQAFLFTLVATFILGLIFLWFITRNLNNIIQTVKRFKQGDLQARIPVKSKDELAQLSITFNDMAATILKQIEDLKTMGNLRRELVANVSHDLRTPISVIHGYIETLIIKEGNITEENRKKYLDIVLESTDKLKNLVTELFELSKLEARQIKPNIEPFFIAEMVQDIVQKYQLLAEEKKIKIKSEILADNSLVYADIALIERVLQNLIDNALKFTPEEGEIVIAVHQTETNLEVRVKDTGPGIPENQIPFIFDRYHKVSDEVVTPNKNGTGLGLAIVKKILEIHNTTIHLSSKLNEGTSFSFSLPKSPVPVETV